jgi:hypothetical protein
MMGCGQQVETPDTSLQTSPLRAGFFVTGLSQILRTSDHHAK